MSSKLSSIDQEEMLSTLSDANFVFEKVQEEKKLPGENCQQLCRPSCRDCGPNCRCVSCGTGSCASQQDDEKEKETEQPKIKPSL